MLTKDHIQRLAEMRLEDAIHLLRAGRDSAAYYLAGYAIELALKVCISKLFLQNAIPDKGLVNATYTHSLEQLINTSGLQPLLREDMKADPVLGSYWGVVTKWDESSRYEFWDRAAAQTLIQAIVDKDHGVFPWVKKHWQEN